MPEAPFITLPSAVRAKLDQVDHEVQAFWEACWSWYGAVDPLPIDPSEFSVVGDFKQEWDAFYADASTLWNANYQTALTFEERLAALWPKARAWGVPGLPDRVTPETPSSLPSLLPQLGLTLGIAVAVLAVVLVVKYA